MIHGRQDLSPALEAQHRSGSHALRQLLTGDLAIELSENAVMRDGLFAPIKAWDPMNRTTLETATVKR